MSAHTPGPWRLLFTPFGRPLVQRGDEGGFVVSGNTRGRELDDAYLISAAPDMLQALLFAERHCPCGARPESPDTHPHVAGCVIATAIKKARGET